jgi:nifR3 family TIM-barrel protein
MGSAAATFGRAAREMVRAGYDVVDINFGCPVGKVLGRCRGGWLLRQPAEALAIVDAVVQSVAGDAPVTVKMRRGYDDTPEAEAAFFAILHGAFECGIAAVTVHGRTVVQKYVGSSRWQFLARVKRELGDRTVLGSGDLFSAFEVVRMLSETGVDGVTVARGCIGNPFVFEQVRELLAGRKPAAPTPARQRAALARHAELAWQHYGERALPSARMHAIKYAQYHSQAAWARDRFVAVRSRAELDAAIEQVFGGSCEGERELRPEDAVVPE